MNKLLWVVIALVLTFFGSIGFFIASAIMWIGAILEQLGFLSGMLFDWYLTLVLKAIHKVSRKLDAS